MSYLHIKTYEEANFNLYTHNILLRTHKRHNFPTLQLIITPAPHRSLEPYLI